VFLRCAFFVFVVGRGGLLVCFAVGFHWVGSFLFCSLAIQNVWILLTDNSLYSFGIALKFFFVGHAADNTEKNKDKRHRKDQTTDKQRERTAILQGKNASCESIKNSVLEKKNDFPMFPAKEIPGRSQIPSITTR